jgi:hypothetical protein
MRNVQKIKCILCGNNISAQNIKKHLIYCAGLGPKYKRPKPAQIRWNKGKTYKELFGEKKANEISKKISSKLVGKHFGCCKNIDAEKERRHKISLSMKGNKNGATVFRRKNINYKNIIFKSKWEVNVAMFLDDNKINWKYENITYDLSETTSYTPDFSIYENEIFKKHIEVKGYFRKENKEKFDKFLNLYPKIKIEVWNKSKLLENNISIV